MKPFQIYILIFITSLTIGCQNKEIQIPTSDKPGIQEISNYSEIWMFMKVMEKDTTLQLNDNNLIGATNWIFNIDKHLNLAKVMPKIQSFQEKRLKRASDEKEKFDNYLSYSDTINKILSFVDISNTQYHFDTIQSKKNILKKLEYYKDYNNIHLSMGMKSYYLNENKIDKVDFFDTLTEFISFTENGQKTLLHLNFNQQITYQEYLNFKTQLLSYQKELFFIDKNEYIFDANKIPECGCDL